MLHTYRPKKIVMTKMTAFIGWTLVMCVVGMAQRVMIVGECLAVVALSIHVANVAA
tara:strand:+ start:344 stop:511 length:168 start_codon:yes stop_codon:yes gene_type:complete